MKHTYHLTFAGLLFLFCVVQAQACSGLFITTYGEISSSDCPWVVRVSDTNQAFQISYRYNIGTNCSGRLSVISPSNWRAKSGWFVFIESDERIWAYDGGSSLFLQVARHAKPGPSCTSYGPGSFPCAVPDEVLARLSPEARATIKSADTKTVTNFKKVATPLFTRAFHLDPAVLSQMGLQVPAKTGETRQGYLLRYFKAQQIEFVPPAFLKFDEASGRLTVRTTEVDLDKIQRLIFKPDEKK